MKHPETIWVLPHRDQSGDEDVLKEGRLCKLSAALQVEQLPKELVVGIPESVLMQHREDDLIFAQYVRQPLKNRALFALSITCGNDKDGRTVYLTAIEILGLTDRPLLKLPVEGLPERERRIAETLLSRFGSRKDKWVRRTVEMLDAADRNREIDSFASVLIPNAAYPPRWTPEKKKLSGRLR